MKPADRVPGDAPLVVRPDLRSLLRVYGSVSAVWVLLTLLYLLPAFIAGDRPVLTYASGALAALNAALWMYLLYTCAFTGPHLAADRDRVWLRLAGTFPVRVVELPWTAIENVRLHQVRALAISYPYLCLDAPSLDDRARTGRAGRWARRRTGTPFAINARFTEGEPAELLRRLREYSTAIRVPGPSRS